MRMVNEFVKFVHQSQTCVIMTQLLKLKLDLKVEQILQ